MRGLGTGATFIRPSSVKVFPLSVSRLRSGLRTRENRNSEEKEGPDGSGVFLSRESHVEERERRGFCLTGSTSVPLDVLMKDSGLGSLLRQPRFVLRFLRVLGGVVVIGMKVRFPPRVPPCEVTLVKERLKTRVRVRRFLYSRTLDRGGSLDDWRGLSNNVCLFPLLPLFLG